VAKGAGSACSLLFEHKYRTIFSHGDRSEPASSGARGEGISAFMENARDHACSDHGFLGIPPELADKVMAAIRDEEAASA
jgi:Protein of unknown function (DUF1059)